MRYLTLVAFVCGFAFAPAAAQAPDPQLIAPIQKFIDSFNKGDTVAAMTTHAAGADLTIIDEVPPFIWRGAKAFQAWSTAFESASKQAAITDQMVTLSAAIRTESSADSAYVVVPAVYTFKEKGVAMREAGQMTFALKKGTTGWLIHGWTWTGPKAQRAAASAKK
jgi:hypothetical protein